MHKRLSIHFAARVGPDMNLAASFVAYCVSGLSCAVPTSDLYCCVSCSSRPSAQSRKPLPTVFDPGATVTFHFVCSSCFLPLKPNPSAFANVCFGSCVQKKPSAFRPTFPCRNSTDFRKPGPMRSLPGASHLGRGGGA